MLHRTLASLFISALFTLSSLVGARAQIAKESVDGAENQCQALVAGDFSGVPGAPTHIDTAVLVTSPDALFSQLAASLPPDLVAQIRQELPHLRPFCRVSGYVTPNVGFEVSLPISNWNGKFIHMGCGGWCGSSESFWIACGLLASEYACVGTDMGHKGRGGLWARNNLQAQIDFSYRATHVATLAGKAIAERYYRRSLQRSYFYGCSTGGYQGMVEAQLFPWDFNGIIAGAPDMDEADLAVRGIWVKRHFMGADGKPILSERDIRLVHEGALAACDMDDGLKDGIISDPVNCRFAPATLQCDSGRHVACLTAEQVTVVKELYGTPATSDGKPFSTRAVLPGSELNWGEAFSHVWGEDFFRDLALLPSPGSEWRYTDFDFDRDYQRSGVGVLFADTNPDLRKFKDAGGKLISYQGANDAWEFPGGIVDYYETAEKTLGGRAVTQDFFRLFLVPGMNHCGGGAGAFAVDYLSYLEAWVERGKPPDRTIGAHVSDLGKYQTILKLPLDPGHRVSFTRPIYPYPVSARYSGAGDPRSADSFISARSSTAIAETDGRSSLAEDRRSLDAHKAVLE
jgi:hypothetical protein